MSVTVLRYPDLIHACMVCGQWRADEAISVAHRHLGKPHLPLPFNVRYCNDRPVCAAAALAEGPWTGGAAPGPLPPGYMATYR